MQTGLALVTGATGFVGAHVARVCLEEGYQLRCLVRVGSDRRNLPSGPSVQIVEGDLRDPRSLRKAVEGCAEIFHVAADYRLWSASPQELYESNVQGTSNLLECAMEAGVEKVVYTSTVGTMGLSSLPRSADETTPPLLDQANGHYKRSKKQAERIALGFAARGFPVVVVNPGAPIGPWDRKPTPTGKIVVDFANGRLPAYVDTGLSFAHVRDVARGHWLAARKGRSGERYILGGENLSMLDFLRILGRLTGREPPRIRVPHALAWGLGWASTRLSDWVTHREPAVPLEAVRMARHRMYFDSSKAVRELGYAPTPVRLAASEALQWFEQHGYLNKKTNGGSQVWQSQ